LDVDKDPKGEPKDEKILKVTWSCQKLTTKNT
jgi:hypothetical protein